MAEYLGESDIKNAIFSATEQVINENKVTTSDIGGNAGTTQMTDSIAVYAKQKLRR
jgi:isocitrate dehydrogenase